MLLIVLSETWKFKDFLSITFAGALTVASFMACFLQWALIMLSLMLSKDM